MRQLFVLGHGRSGTTVLLNALNACPDVFLLGEANIHYGHDRFRERFNAQHASFGNQRTKSSYAPRLQGLDEQATGEQYLCRLGQDYRYVGEKIALSPLHDYDVLRDIFEEERGAAAIVWSLRRPSFALASGRRVFGHSDPRAEVHACARSLLWMIELARLRRDFHLVILEQIEASQFRYIGAALDLDLSSAIDLYTSPPLDEPVSLAGAGLQEQVVRLDAAYLRLVEAYDSARCNFAPAELASDQKLPGFELPGVGLPRANRLGQVVRDLMEVEAATAPLMTCIAAAS